MSAVVKWLDGLRCHLHGMEVSLGLGDFMFDGDSATPKRGTVPQFLVHVYYGQTAGWMKIEDTTWYGSRPRPRPHCIRWGPSSPRKGHIRPLISAHVYCGHGRPSQLLLSSCLCLSRSCLGLNTCIMSCLGSVSSFHVSSCLTSHDCLDCVSVRHS